MSLEGYKEVQDITKEVGEKVEKEYQFPNSIKILEAKLMIGPNGWGSYVYYLMIKYEIDEVQYIKTEQIVTNISGTLHYMLDEIKNFYERMHVIQ